MSFKNNPQKIKIKIKATLMSHTLSFLALLTDLFSFLELFILAQFFMAEEKIEK